jgi:hypothetical protein
MSSISHYLILNNTNYFADADEYIKLKQLFKTETFYEKLSVFMKLIGNLLLSILWKSSRLSLGLTVYRLIEEWKQYIRYRTLKTKIHEWKDILHSIGGPFISTNDDTYQSYVYADGMQRLHTALLGLPKERTKRLE